jgi:hypothetical protein
LRAAAPRALRAAEIRAALQRDRGVAIAFTSIRHALNQLQERHQAKLLKKRWRHQRAETDGPTSK